MSSGEVASTLLRIRRIISESCRVFQSSNHVPRDILSSCLTNLDRIENSISSDTLNLLKNTINDLLSLVSTEDSQSQYVSEKLRSEGRGRPRIDISEEQLQLFYTEGYTAIQMAQQLGCSKDLVYKKLKEKHLSLRKRYSTISDEDLRQKIMQVHMRHPKSGYVMMAGYLRAEGLFIQRKRIRSILSEIDPIGTSSRWSSAIRRRSYKVPSPNSLWHMDAHLKLARWGFVIHGCIDGYSRMIMYLSCTTSIQAEPVLKLFTKAIQTCGLPSRVRSDHGYENILVAVLMNLLRGMNRGSHISGKSVHNQRIERLWLDVYKEVVYKMSNELYGLEDERLLNVDNPIHRFCVQYIYKPYINHHLKSFKIGWNLHAVRTERNKNPRQLWLNGILNNYNSDSTAVAGIFNETSIVNQISSALQLNGVNVSTIIQPEEDIEPSAFTAVLDLSFEQKNALQRIYENPTTSLKEKYCLCVSELQC